jgi:hypothetical protein
MAQVKQDKANHRELEKTFHMSFNGANFVSCDHFIHFTEDMNKIGDKYDKSTSIYL